MVARAGPGAAGGDGGELGRGGRSSGVLGFGAGMHNRGVERGYGLLGVANAVTRSVSSMRGCGHDDGVAGRAECSGAVGMAALLEQMEWSGMGEGDLGHIIG